MASDAASKYQILGSLGGGSFGEVVKALNRQTSQVVAIKVVPIETDNVKELRQEIAILKKCQSKYVVNYIESCRNGNELWIVMEYCGAGSVGDVIRITGRTLTEPQLAVICKETLKGLKYLHSNNLIHRDIKARNILLNHKGQCKLADFGVSTQLQQTISKRNTVIGSPFWMAPEVFKQNTYDQKADIWSLGITVIEMAEGKPPLSELPPLRALLKIPTNDPPTLYDKEKWSDSLHDFLRRCLVLNSNERWSAKELLQHKFIKSAGKRTITAALVNNAMPLVEQFREKKSGKNTPTQQANGGHRTKPAKIVRNEAKTVTISNSNNPKADTNVDKRSFATSGSNDWSTMVRHDPAVEQIKKAFEKEDSSPNNNIIHRNTPSQNQTPTSTLTPTPTPTPTQTQIQKSKPKFDIANPYFKSSPYCSADGESLDSWQLFDIDKNDNIRSKDWIVRSVLEPFPVDDLDMEKYLPENPTHQQLEALKQKLLNAHKRDQDLLEQHYISVRRQIRERIQNVNNKTRTHKISIDSNNASPRAVQQPVSKPIQVDKTSKPKSTTTDTKSTTTDTKSNQAEKTKNVKSDNQNLV